MFLFAWEKKYVFTSSISIEITKNNRVTHQYNWGVFITYGPFLDNCYFPYSIGNSYENAIKIRRELEDKISSLINSRKKCICFFSEFGSFYGEKDF